MERNYQICNRCVMDTTDPDILFDENGICNHCKSAEAKLKKITFNSDEERDVALNQIVDDIKQNGKKRKYDCIIGLSGGVDSSFLAYRIKELGLRPLAVHFDNGWNSELAVKNIENIVNKLGIDLITNVIDWDEFRDLQVAFLKAGVVDLEMLSDNAIVVSVYRIMKKYKINYFLIGSNIVTESIMPKSWFYVPKYDSLNIRSIYKKFGIRRKFKTYPILNAFEFIKYHYFKGHKSIALLDYLHYNKPEALIFLKDKLEYKPYPGKHYESKITQFYQSFILPHKYNIDKRKAHLSSMIVSGQILREDAIRELEKALFKSDLEKENDITFFCKKLQITRDEFWEIINSKPVSHSAFSSYKDYHKKLAAIVKKIIKLGGSKN